MNYYFIQNSKFNKICHEKYLHGFSTKLEIPPRIVFQFQYRSIVVVVNVAHGDIA